MLVSKTFTFEASHQLQYDGGKCARLHGHSWKLTVFIEGEKDSTGIVVNFRDIKSELEPLIEGLDHWHLGYHREDTKWCNGGSCITSPVICRWFQAHDIGLLQNFEPTSENLLWVIAWWVEEHTSFKDSWHTLRLSETCTTAATLTWNEYHERKEEESYAWKALQQSREEGNEEGEQEEDDIPF